MSSSQPPAPFPTSHTTYGDLCIILPIPPPPPTEFASRLTATLTPPPPRGAWLRLPFDAAHLPLLPIAHAAGFSLAHSVSSNILTLQRWAPVTPNPTPPGPHTDVGAAALVISSAGNVLVIRDAFDGSGRAHFPGGHVDEDEDGVAAALREAGEETGVRGAVGLGVLCVKTLLLNTLAPPPPVEEASPAGQKALQRTRFGTTNIGIFCLAAVADETLAPDPVEVAWAGWLPPLVAVAALREYESALLSAALELGLVDAAARVARGEAAGSHPALIRHSLTWTPRVEGAPYPTHYLTAFPSDVWDRALVAGRAAQASPPPALG